MINYDSMQFVAFTTALASSSALDIWNEHVGAEQPMRTMRHPVGSSEVAGDWARNTLAIAVQPTRIDVVIGTGPVTDTDAIPVIVDPERTLRRALKIIKSAVKSASVVRVAVVFQRSEDVAGLPGAVARIRDIVPGLPSPAGATDVYYQASVPRISKSGLNLTQLGRWQVARKVFVAMPPGAISAGVVAGGPSRNAGVIVNHYADVFVVPDQPPMRAKQIGPVFDELAELAKDLLSKGYAALN